MGAEFIWTIPVRGDGRRARPDEWNRGDWHLGLPTSPSWVRDDRRGTFDPFDHLVAVIEAGEHGGFDGLFVPYDTEGEESWIVATVAARATRWARTIVEFSPSITTPVYASKLSATFQRIAKGRLDWKLALDLDDATAASQGDHVQGLDRYVRADEFVTIARAVWREQGFDFDGRYYAVDSGGLNEPLNVHAFPRVFLSGNTSDALDLSAKHADVHIFDALPNADLLELVAEIRELASEKGRSPRLGLALPIVAREDASEAWARVLRLLEERSTGTASDLEALKVAPGLWEGFDRIGFSSSIGLVGSHEEVQSRLEEYLELGIEVFVLDGYPHVEEAYRLGQLLLSRFAAQPTASAIS